METKISKLIALYNSGDHSGALTFAAKFPQLGKHKPEITRGADAIKHPNFYKQLGKDPEELRSAGLRALRDRYGLD